MKKFSGVTIGATLFTITFVTLVPAAKAVIINGTFNVDAQGSAVTRRNLGNGIEQITFEDFIMTTLRGTFSFDDSRLTSPNAAIPLSNFVCDCNFGDGGLISNYSALAYFNDRVFGGISVTGTFSGSLGSNLVASTLNFTPFPMAGNLTEGLRFNGSSSTRFTNGSRILGSSGEGIVSIDRQPRFIPEPGMVVGISVVILNFFLNKKVTSSPKR